MFSVVIPAYNAEKLISTSIESVLKQTHKDLELIVVDDGSRDGTKTIVERYNDERIKYIYQDNGGVSSARNKGIRESTGDYVCFLDADDEWKEDHLEVLNELIKKYNHCGLFITGYDIRLNNGEIVHKSRQILRRVDSEQIASDNGFDVLLKNGYFFNTNTVCCKREVFDKVGMFAVGVKNGEDDDMWFRIFAYFPIAVSKKVTTVYDRSNCGATGQRTVFEHMFLSRVGDILSSPEVPQYRKDSILVWVERNKLSQARKHILSGNKREAWKLIKVINFRKTSKKKHLETLLCMLIPSKMVRNRIDKRDTGYYK